MLQIGIREPGSAITHFIAMMMAIFATSPLLVKAALNGNHTTILAMAVFMGSMVAALWCKYGVPFACCPRIKL